MHDKKIYNTWQKTGRSMEIECMVINKKIAILGDFNKEIILC